MSGGDTHPSDALAGVTNVNLPHDESLSAPSLEDLAHQKQDAPAADALGPEQSEPKQSAPGLSALADALGTPWLFRLPLLRVFRRPADGPRPVLRTVASSVALLAALLAPALIAGLSLLGGNAPHGQAAAAALHRGHPNNRAIRSDMAHFMGADPNLPPATAPPAPDPPTLANAAPLRPHEVFGFAPYWTLSQESGFNVDGMSTLAYFSLDVNPDGSVQTSGAGWDGYQSQALADLVTRAHAANDRAVLTVTDFDQASLDQLTSSPTAAQTLANQLVQLVGAKNLDGVNLDFEGQGAADQAGLTSLVSTVSSALKTVNPHYQVTMDTYASSAGDTGGFYNVPALAPAVDAFFVMAYNLNVAGSQSATSPLTSGLFSDQTAVDEYAANVPPSKVILGLPYFGLDWPTTDGTLTAQAQGGSTPVSLAQVQASGHPIYWDATTSTGWTSYQVGSQWHEMFFETPTSFYLGAAMAQNSGLAGVGIWALGMDGNDPADLSALLGFAPAVKGGPAGPAGTSLSPKAPTSPAAATTAPTTSAGSRPQSPPSSPPSTSKPTTPGSGSGPPSGSGGGTTTTTTPPPPTTTTTTTTQPNPPPFTYTGDWNLTSVQLTAVAAGTPPPQVTGGQVGYLTLFATNDPAATCLAAEPGLSVYAVSGSTTEFLVQAAAPTDCTTMDFVFTVP
jgi:hypothetical protein